MNGAKRIGAPCDGDATLEKRMVSSIEFTKKQINGNMMHMSNSFLTFGGRR